MITVHAKSGARSDSIVASNRLDEYCVTVKARPIDGVANKAIVDLLSVELGVPKSLIILSSGEKSKVKRFKINNK